jgi:hypothetical protein
VHVRFWRPAIGGRQRLQHLIYLIVGHVRVHRQADVPRAQVLGHGERGPGELCEHRLPVQRQIVYRASEPDLVTLGQQLAQLSTVGTRRQHDNVLIEVGAAAGRLGQRRQPVQAREGRVVPGRDRAAPLDELRHLAKVHLGGDIDLPGCRPARPGLEHLPRGLGYRRAERPHLTVGEQRL